MGTPVQYKGLIHDQDWYRRLLGAYGNDEGLSQGRSNGVRVAESYIV